MLIFFFFFFFFDSREEVINFFRNYSLLLSETKYKAKHGRTLKILTPKQMLQRLPITATWLPHGQRWAIFAEVASLTQC